MTHNFFHVIVSVGVTRGLMVASLLFLGSATVWARAPQMDKANSTR